MADDWEEELEEDEVWAAMTNHVHGHSPRRHSKPQACGRDHHHHAPAALPLHGHGTASNSTREKQHMRYSSPPNKTIQQAASTPSGGSGRSAPVSIPDWSKIYGRSKAGGDGEHSKDGGGEDDDDGEEERVPPHEWLARKMAGSCQVSSFSVCEGAGRTLKGRDLSRVRNAVLSKTGFLEHLDDGHRH